MQNWFVTVTRESQTKEAPRLAKSIFFFELGAHESESEAQAAWKRLGFCLPDSFTVAWTSEETSCYTRHVTTPL
jgi:hypothetical protein